MDIQQRIADILYEHEMLECSWGVEPNDCTCGFGEKIPVGDPRYGHGWSDHVAGVLVSELGLTREDGATGITGTYNRDPSLVPYHRYVTKWMPDA